MKLKQTIKTGAFTVFGFCAMLNASAQNAFKYAAAVQKVDSTGFYKIDLQTAFIAKCNAGLSDIRLADEKGNFVPYVTAANVPLTSGEKYIKFPQISAAAKRDTGTTFIVECREQKPVSKLSLKLRNTYAQRYMNLSGSDDLGHWFAIEENISLNDGVAHPDGTYTEEVTFPASNYRYLRFLVNDKNKAAVKFLEAGIYKNTAVQDSYQPILPVVTKQADSDKATFITIKLYDNYQVNKLHLTVSEPKYFKRPIAVYDDGGKWPVLISESELNSETGTDLLLSVKTNRLLVKIDNADNQPLTISGAEVSQAEAYIVSYLKAGQSYKLLTGDNKASAPDYDLKFFTDHFGNNIPVISHGAVVANALASIPSKITKPDNTVIIWAAIIVALLLLSVLTVKMLAEVKKKTENGQA